MVASATALQEHRHLRFSAVLAPTLFAFSRSCWRIFALALALGHVAAEAAAAGGLCRLAAEIAGLPLDRWPPTRQRVRGVA